MRASRANFHALSVRESIDGKSRQWGITEPTRPSLSISAKVGYRASVTVLRASAPGYKRPFGASRTTSASPPAPEIWTLNFRSWRHCGPNLTRLERSLLTRSGRRCPSGESRLSGHCGRRPQRVEQPDQATSDHSEPVCDTNHCAMWSAKARYPGRPAFLRAIRSRSRSAALRAGE